MNTTANSFLKTNTKHIAALSFCTAVVLAVTTLSAQARPSTRSFTCGGLKDFIADHGAVVMNHKSASLYQRFVDNRSYCSYRETTKAFTVPTKSGRCRLYICQEPLEYLFHRDD